MFALAGGSQISVPRWRLVKKDAGLFVEVA